MTNLYIPFRENAEIVWYKLVELTPKSTLESSNKRVYLNQINWPIGHGDSTVKLDYPKISYALNQSEIKLPRDYRKKSFSLNEDKDKEIAASLVFDGVNDLITLSEDLAEEHPFSLAYLLKLNKRKLFLSPTLFLFDKKSSKR